MEGIESESYHRTQQPITEAWLGQTKEWVFSEPQTFWEVGRGGYFLPLLTFSLPASLRSSASRFLSFSALETFCSKKSSSFWMTEPITHHEYYVQVLKRVGREAKIRDHEKWFGASVAALLCCILWSQRAVFSQRPSWRLGNGSDLMLLSLSFSTDKTGIIKIAVCTYFRVLFRESNDIVCKVVVSWQQINHHLCWRNEEYIWIVQGGDRKHNSEISQGYSVMKFPVLSGLMSSHLMQWTAVYFISLNLFK